MANDDNKTNNIADILGTVTGAAAGTAGGAANSVIGAGVNLPTQLVSAAATVVDGSITAVGEGVAAGSGLVTTGATGFVDLICGWARGIVGTVGGYLNNAVIDVVKVVDKDAAENIPRDPDLKKHFGELGDILGKVVNGDGQGSGKEQGEESDGGSKGVGLNGVRSTLSWGSPSASWGGDNLFSAISHGLETIAPSDDKAQNTSVVGGILGSAASGVLGLIDGIGGAVLSLIPGGNADNSTQGTSSTGGILGSAASGVLGLIDGIGNTISSLIPGGDTAQNSANSVASSEEKSAASSEQTLAQSADMPAFDSLAAQSYEQPLYDGANTMPVII